MVPETRVFQAADGEDLLILACTVFDWSTCVTCATAVAAVVCKKAIKNSEQGFHWRFQIIG